MTEKEISLGLKNPEELEMALGALRQKDINQEDEDQKQTIATVKKALEGGKNEPPLIRGEACTIPATYIADALRLLFKNTEAGSGDSDPPSEKIFKIGNLLMRICDKADLPNF